MKTCTKCGVGKPLSEFYRIGNSRTAKTKDGHFGECKVCNIARVRAWQRQADPARIAANQARYARNRKLRQIYGITPAEYVVTLAAQDGRCAICGTTDPGRTSLFFPVDHDHSTGAVRGLLCHDCNLGIANFADDPDRLVAAAAYLLSTRNVLAEVF